MKNDPLPTEAEVRRALRVLVRGYLIEPDEGDAQSLRVTPAAWGHARDVLNRLRLDPADPRCRYCGAPVDAPGMDHENGCPKAGDV